MANWVKDRDGAGSVYEGIALPADVLAKFYGCEEAEVVVYPRRIRKVKLLAEFKPSAELRSACMNDAFKLCSASLFSMDSLLACLQAKKSQASPQCQAKYDAESKTAARK